MASRMLGAEPGHNKSILVVSDGDFTENDIADLAAAARGAIINTMGVGTAEGVPIPSPDGGWVKDAKGQILIDRLHAERLQALSAVGHGIYVQATYDNSDTRALLNHIGGTSDEALVGGKTIRTWDEGFYIPALILALLILPWFRKGATFLTVLMLLAIPTHNAHAADIKDWFYNPAQQGEADFAAGHYDEAIKKFTNPYQQGVAAYKAAQYAQAAALFKAAASEKNSNLAAEYNLGNAQLMQNSPEDAIKSYETVLKQNPNDASAKHNLEIARKLLQQKQQQQNQQQSENSKSQEGKQDQQKSGASQSGEQNQQEESQPQQPQSAQRQGKNKAQQQAGQKNEGQSLSQQLGTQGLQQNEQQRSEKTGASPAQEKSASSPETAKDQPPGVPQAGTEAADSRNGQPNDQVTAVRPRTQLDINVDQWLNHIQSDPGSFLKNQFMIEEKKSAEGQEEKQQ
jgi:Ca-activated chloride channel family protein